MKTKSLKDLEPGDRLLRWDGDICLFLDMFYFQEKKDEYLVYSFTGFVVYEKLMKRMFKNDNGNFIVK